MEGAGSASHSTAGLRPRPASKSVYYWSGPARFWEAHEAPPIYLPVPTATEGRLDNVQPMPIAMLMKTPNSSGHHVGQLNTHAHMRRGQENPLDEVSIRRSVSSGFSNKPVVLLPKTVVFPTVAMIANYNAVGFVSACARHALKEILKSFGDDFVGSKVDIILLIHVPESIGERCVTHSADQPNRLCAGDDAEDCGPEIVSAILVPLSHGIVGVIILGCKVAPFHFATIVFLALQPHKLISNAMPSFLWNYDATKDKEARPVAIWLCGRSALIYKAKVHPV